ncbi:hypothetical protein UlMin_023094, partial [Ulmus minor]
NLWDGAKISQGEREAFLSYLENESLRLIQTRIDLIRNQAEDLAPISILANAAAGAAVAAEDLGHMAILADAAAGAGGDAVAAGAGGDAVAAGAGGDAVAAGAGARARARGNKFSLAEVEKFVLAVGEVGVG